MKTAIVEISESHEECIYSQLSFLKDAGHEVTLLLHTKLDQQISEYANLADKITYFDFTNISEIHKIILQWRLFLAVKDFDLLILNTAHSYSVVRNISVLLRLFKTKCVGILHNTKKLRNSHTQKIISKKVKQYFVLNDNLVDTEVKTNSIKLQSFYPIFFPRYEKVPMNKGNYVWIGIPGRIDYERRDYDFLINALSKIHTINRVQFLILGKIDQNSSLGIRLHKSIEKSRHRKSFKIFHSFIDNHVFHAYLGACNFIMPLLKLDEDYLTSKISGTFNLAFAHKKPMLCNSFFRDIPDLEANSIFYNEASFAQIINDIDKGNVTVPTSYTDLKWGYNFQQNRYIDFINK